MHIHSFAPLAGFDARVLIVGTMPGKASLLAQQYYAHPRNGFWPIMSELLHFDARMPYAQRTAALTDRGIALWDVLQSCTRTSSLDADIESGSVIANDFAAFFAKHPRIHTVCFNGAIAALLYRRHVASSAGSLVQDVDQVRFPSTSPAHAAMSLATKAQAWHRLAQLLQIA